MSCEVNINQVKDALSNIVKQVRECLNKDSISEKEVENLVKSINEIIFSWRDFVSETVELLEFLEKITDERAKKHLNKLILSLKGLEIRHKLNSIEKSAWNTHRNESLIKAIDRNRFKLIENTRLEKFDEVIYILERIFFANQELPPMELIKLLTDPLVPSEIKKSAVYLFLSATFRQKKEES